MSSFRLGTAVRSMGIVYCSFRVHEMTQLSQTPCLCALYEPYPALAAVLACAFSPTSINDDLLPGKINGICEGLGPVFCTILGPVFCTLSQKFLGPWLALGKAP